MYKFIDLFAGIGGMRIAFENQGMSCIFSSEWDKFAAQTYEENHGDKPHGDIRLISSQDIPNFDVLVGGFPCQPFSTIGRRKGLNDVAQGDLFFEIVRILRDKQPNAFLLENVLGILTIDNGKTIEMIEEILNEIGYNTYIHVLNSAEYGVPQIRKRVYIVGFRKKLRKKFNYISPNIEKRYINEYLEDINDDKYSITEHNQKNYLFKKNDGRPQIVNKESKIQVKTLVSTYHKIQRLTGTFVEGGETGIRLLSENEAKAIMGFPKDFKFPVSRTQMYRQLGNSVAIPVIESLASQIKEFLKSYEIKRD